MEAYVWTLEAEVSNEVVAFVDGGGVAIVCVCVCVCVCVVCVCVCVCVCVYVWCGVCVCGVCWCVRARARVRACVCVKLPHRVPFVDWFCTNNCAEGFVCAISLCRSCVGVVCLVGLCSFYLFFCNKLIFVKYFCISDVKRWFSGPILVCRRKKKGKNTRKCSASIRASTRPVGPPGQTNILANIFEGACPNCG